MIAVFEGTDHAGKTSLAYRLAWEFQHGPLLSDRPHRQVHRLHKGPPDERHILSQYEKDILNFGPEMLTSLDHLFILDRWHIGEMLYGPLLRSKSRLNAAQLTHIELLLSSLGATRLMVMADAPSLRRRHNLEPDDLVTERESTQMQDAYLRVAEDLGTWHLCDMSDGSKPDVREILTQMIVHSGFAAALADFRSYVGHVSPTALLVGDKPGGTPPSWARAFLPMRPGSADSLLRSLFQYPQLRWHELGFVNQEGTDLLELWRALCCPRIICLGKEAEKAVTAAEFMAYDVLPHPQFIKRFQSHDWGDYIDELVTLLKG